MILTKEFKFDAAHKLAWHEGKCKNLHGHTYKLQVFVSGKVNENGIIIDFYELKKIVSEKVLEKLDHSNLNDIIDNPTAENIVIWIWEQLRDSLNLSELKLWETDTSFVSYTGSD
jgi:6-pyruvoyltetrahydropterin/6-carboxytetrahydropterin synthase